MKKRLIGRRTSWVRVADASQFVVRHSLASALIVPPNHNSFPLSPMLLTATIKQEARSLGFDAVGIASIGHNYPSTSHRQSTAPCEDDPAALPQRLLERLSRWIQRGYHGSMAWMERTPEKRADPRLVLPDCQSIISVGINYLTEHRANEQPGYGRIARYAWGKDYHKLFDSRLKKLEQLIHKIHPEAKTRSYSDTGPIMEKAWAERAGLGWIGKHSNLVSAEHGSWLLLGEILTTLNLEPDDPATDLCGSCTLCIQACPTKAITEPYIVDATRCISYLTIELRGDATGIPQDLQSGMGNKIFGCDDCLDVCPFNLRSEPTHEETFQPTELTLAPDLKTLCELDEPTFSVWFRQSPVRRAKLHGLRRNVTIAQQNMNSL